VYITESLYVPEYFYKMLETLNIALLATLIGFTFGFMLCFVAAKNLTASRWLRFVVRRFMEILRAFPEIVIAGFFLAIFSLGPIPAIIAVAIHTIGALGKMFFEVVENADMKPDEGLRAVGGNWFERVWFGIVPQVMPNFISYFLLRLEINVRASTIHRRGWRRRHRRGAAAFDQPRPRGQDARHHPSPVRHDHLRRPAFGLAAQEARRQAGLRIRTLTMTTLTADQIDDIERRHPDAFRQPFLKRFAYPIAIAVLALYTIYAWWFFSIGTVMANGNWNIAGAYLADWVSYEVRPDVEYKTGDIVIDLSAFLAARRESGSVLDHDRRGPVTVVVEETDTSDSASRPAPAAQGSAAVSCLRRRTRPIPAAAVS
jgi:hypothetical protein